MTKTKFLSKRQKQIEVCKKISKANAEFQQLLTECKLKNYDQN